METQEQTHEKYEYDYDYSDGISDEDFLADLAADFDDGDFDDYDSNEEETYTANDYRDYDDEEEDCFDTPYSGISQFGYMHYYFQRARANSHLVSYFECRSNPYQLAQCIHAYPMQVRVPPAKNPHSRRYSIRVTMHDPEYQGANVIHVMCHTSQGAFEDATWHGKLRGKALYRMIMAIAKYYNNAAVESIPVEILIKLSAQKHPDTGEEESETERESNPISTENADAPRAKPC